MLSKNNEKRTDKNEYDFKKYKKCMKNQATNSYVRFIARFDAEPIRKAGQFIIKNWWWEPTVESNDEIREMIVNEIARFTEFLQIDNSPKNIITLGV